jgi:DNA-binding NarL/FixJ family response regulator
VEIFDMKRRHVRVLVADDHDVVRKGVCAILEAREGWHVCAEASNGIEAVSLAADRQPDVAIIDLEMRELDGLAVTRQIKKLNPHIEVVIFTMHDDDQLIRDVLSAGARTFVLKSEGVRMLVKAVEGAIEHKSFFPARASETLLNTVRSSHGDPVPPPSPLTEREREIVQLLAEGKSNKETAQALGISVRTVETHRAAIMRKLGVTSIVKLVRYAVREGFIKA